MKNIVAVLILLCSLPLAANARDLPAVSPDVEGYKEFKNIVLQAYEEAYRVETFNLHARAGLRIINKGCIDNQVDAEHLAARAGGAFFRFQFYQRGGLGRRGDMNKGVRLAKEAIEQARRCKPAQSWKNNYVYDAVPGGYPAPSEAADDTNRTPIWQQPEAAEQTIPPSPSKETK